MCLLRTPISDPPYDELTGVLKSEFICPWSHFKSIRAKNSSPVPSALIQFLLCENHIPIVWNLVRLCSYRSHRHGVKDLECEQVVSKLNAEMHFARIFS